jgi:trigger factor
MTTQLESTGALERRLNLSVSMQDIGAQVDRKLRDMARTLRMPGFRPGKVPLKMVQQSYGQQVQAARKGPVAKLIELERRKNEWLREKFLNR